MKQQLTIEQLKELSKDVLTKQQYHLPTLFAEIKEQDKYKYMCMLLVFKNDNEKELMRERAKEFILNNKIERYFIVIEAWYSKIKYGEQAFKLPRYDKNKEEILVITEYNKDLKNKSILIPFKRTKQKIIFKKEIKEDNLKKLHSGWNFYLEEEGIKERFDKEIKLINKKFANNLTKKLIKKYENDFLKAKTDKERLEIINKILKEGKEIIDKELKK